ncbi:MAG: hypothetical protein A2068_02460 [Ignavibacteria bacterium GWB2_35_6b]|nr:MAG: hypothetical protein A2068_02460 [Ignavibacteria bacterium GWB2_35_6b]
MNNKITVLLLLILFYGISLKAQTPITPSDGATNVALPLASITWTAFDTGDLTGINVYLAADAGITDIVAFATLTSSLSLAIPVTLANNTTYYIFIQDPDVQVGPLVTAGPPNFYSFTTEKVQTTSPTDLESGVVGGTGLNITWIAFNGRHDDVTNGSYDFELFDAAGYNGGAWDGVALETQTPGAGAGSITLTTNLSYLTTYYWRVRDTDNDGNSVDDGAGDNGPWQEYSFTTGAAPTLYPPNNGTDIPVDFGTATFIPFDDGGGFGPYDIQLSTDINFGTTLVNVTNSATTSTTFPTLDFNTTYYWRVKDSDGSGTWYLYTFKTIADYEAYLASPVNLDSNVEPINVPFTWYFDADYDFSIKFYLVYGTASNLAGADTVKNIFSLGNSGLYHMRMDPATQYYWRVISLKNNQMVAFSPISSFTTRGAAAVPEIAYPDNGTTVYLTSPILWWYSLNFHIFHDYEVEWDDNSGFTTPDTIKNIHSVFTYLTGLSGGQTYYWRVRSFNNSIDTSGWSSIASFTTFDVVSASIPNPAYPTGGVEVYSLFPRLYWVLNAPSQGLTYEVRYGLNLSGDNVDVSGVLNTDYWIISDISQLFVTLYDGIVGGETYYWQVRSNNGVTFSDWSDYEEFSIYDFTADLKPILSWPIGGNLVYSTDVNFAWHVEGSSLGLTYRLRYAESPGDLNLAGSVIGTGVEEISSSNLKTIMLSAGTTYYWAVRVNNAENSLNWSDVESFEVIGAGGSNVPLLNWPVGGATVWSTSQDLSWTLVGGGSPTFEVQVFTNVGLSNHFTGSPFTAVAGSPFTISGLAAGTTYYWRVRVEPSEPWSNVEVFTVFAGVSPAVPLAASPSKGVELTSSKATLSWFTPTYSDQNVKFEVEYANSVEMSNSVVVTDLSSPSFEVNELSEGTYFWRTRSKTNNGKYSEYSDIAEFKVTGITDLENEEVLPQKYELSQNYPNPFNPTTAIKYNLPESNYVTLKIYNMLGQEIRTLVSGQANAGSYNVVWNGKDNFGHSVSSGAYIYQIVAGNFIQTRKMILLK